MSSSGQRRAWEDLAVLDPLWAVLSDAAKRYGRWELDAFFQTGRVEIDAVIDKAAARFARPIERGAVLDFGCGVGRLTRALATHFDSCVGVDISAAMIDRAAELNRNVPNCSFLVNSREDLAVFASRSFDMVYTDIVLQHLPRRPPIDRYIREFVRLLRPGGLLVFQLPDRLPLRHRLQPRPRLYAALRRAGVPARQLYGRLGLHPIRMTGASRGHVLRLLEQAGATVLDVEAEPLGDTCMQDRTYYVTRLETAAAGAAAPSDGSRAMTARTAP